MKKSLQPRIRSSWPLVAALLTAACNPGAFDRSPRRADVAVSEAGTSQSMQSEAAGESGEAGAAAQGGAAQGGGAQGGAAGARDAAAGRGGAQAGKGGAAAGRGAPDASVVDDDAGPKPPAPKDAGIDAMVDAGPPVVQCPEGCTASHASGSCVAGACRFECTAGYGDCDADLVLGVRGNGCEAALALDVDNCGRCGRACSAPTAGYTSCDNASCVDYTLAFGPVTANPPHGSPNPNLSEQLCPEGMVVTGFDGFVEDSLIADSVRVHCSPLSLTLGSGGASVTVGDHSAPHALAGAVAWEQIAMVHTEYWMQCAPGEVVSEVVIALWSHWGDAQGVPYPTVKDFGLRCAKPRVDGGKIVLGSPGPALTTGVNRETEQVQVELDSCAASGLIRGFRLGYGSNIDEVVTYCASARVAAQRE